MKKFLLLIAAVVVTMTASAQSKTFGKSQATVKAEKQTQLVDFLKNAKKVDTFGDIKKILSAAPKKQLVKSREGEEEYEKYLLHQLCYPDSAISFYGLIEMPSSATEFRYGTIFNANILGKFVGNTIDAFGFHGPLGTHTNCSVWIMSPISGKILWQQDCSIKEYEYNVVECNTPYTITGEPLMIGYTTFTKTPTNYNYPRVGLWATATRASDCLYFYYNGWNNFSGKVYDDNYAALGLELLTSGPSNRGENDLTVVTADGIRAELSKGNTKFQAYVTNYGINDITSFDYTYEVDGNTTNGSVNVSTPLGYLATGRIAVEEVKPNSKGVYTGKFTVTSVNGTGDGNTADNAVDVPVVALDGGVKRMNVIEEWTSTECGWCPRGVVGLDKIKNNYKNDVIPISVHTWFNQQGDDVLDVPSYEEVLVNYYRGFPDAAINREITGVDPYAAYENLPSIFNQHCEATLGLATSDEDMGASVSITPSIEFNIDVPAKYYGLAYVITEDNITGVDQLNYYYGKPDSYFEGADDLKFLQTVTPTDRKEVSGTVYYYYQPTFNDIARTIDSPWGDKHLLPACKAGEKVTLDPVVIEMPSSIESSKTDDVNVTALLIDQRTGVIVTASRVKFGESGWAVGINKVENATDEPVIEVAEGAFNVTAENATAKVYTMDGKLVTSATVKGSASIPTFGNGAYIIRVEANGQKFAKKAIF